MSTSGDPCICVCAYQCTVQLHFKQPFALETAPGSLVEYFIVSLYCLQDEKTQRHVEWYM